LIVFDWDGMALGNDVLGHQLRALIRWCRGSPVALVSIRSMRSWRYLQNEVEDEQPPALPNVIYDDGRMQIPSWWLATGPGEPTRARQRPATHATPTNQPTTAKHGISRRDSARRKRAPEAARSRQGRRLARPTQVDHPSTARRRTHPRAGAPATCGEETVVAELDQEWRGLLVEFDEDDIAEYRDNGIITDPQFTGAVVSECPDDLRSVDLLTAHEHQPAAPTRHAKSAVLDRVIEHYDADDRLTATAHDDSLRDLIDVARRRRPQPRR